MASPRPLTPELFGSAAALLADAFFTNPAHVYLCPDPRTRRARLAWLLGANLRVQPDLGQSFCLAENGVVDAMGFWTRSDGPEPGALRMLRFGFLTLPFRIGWAGMRRAFVITRAIDGQLERTLGDRPYWYLNNMVVRELLRGSGVGTRLLRDQLALVSAKEPDRAIALSTQRPENVTFYQRLGFRAVLDETVGSGPRAFRSWILVHAPDTTATE
jgi:GNAT superfamily N-acetyltransferase